jgi:acylphosphatase
MDRAFVTYTGRVQGIGFRYTCRSLAKGFSVTGFVRNLEDGRVELTVEGEREEVQGFLDAIQESHLKAFIRARKLDWQPATGEWRDFHIEHL